MRRRKKRHDSQDTEALTPALLIEEVRQIDRRNRPVKRLVTADRRRSVQIQSLAWSVLHREVVQSRCLLEFGADH